ncbi:MAG: carboxypeptidase regulatory-like domain-containing protein [Saprospiraceae bacterium]
MKNLYKILVAGFVMLLVSNFGFSQGSTSASMSGALTDENGEALIGATVVAKHEPTGTVYGTTSRGDGRFNLNGLRVGGPYTIKVSYTGYEEQVTENVFLTLGQTFVFDSKLADNVTVLDEALIVAQRGILSSDRTGASTDISEAEIGVLPTVNRDLTDYVRLTPTASVRGDNIITIAGANNRYNSIYIDGAVNNDVFGLAASGTNGGQTGISPISPDAIEQFNVVVAPYDVKLSGFNGGGINAVTRGGSNVVEGSVYYFMRNENLTGLKVSLDESLPKADRKFAPFTANTYGFRVGAPLIKDKAFIFVNAELQSNETPQPFSFSNYNGDSDEAAIQALARKLETDYGYDPGGYLSKTDKLDGTKILARLDFNLSQNNKLMIRHHYTKGEALYSQASSNSSIKFANDGILFPTTTNSTAVELNSVISDMASNSLIIGFTNVNDDRDPAGDPFPYVEITDGSGFIRFGSEEFSTANSLKQKIFTLTDNFSLYKGKHQFTFGTHNEFFDMYNLFIRQSYGSYRYNSLDDFMTGALPERYFRSYSLLPGDGSEDGAAAAASFKALQLGFYAQDEYSFNKRFTATLGLRIDIPMFLDDPTAATAFNDTEGALMAANGYDLQGAVAGKSPSPQILFSPRLGFNYDLNGDRTVVLRGGVGIFTSRIPFVWPGGMYTNNGVLIASVSASATDIANANNFAFVPDVNQPYDNAYFGKTAGSSQLDLFAKDFKYPQTLRASLAVDGKLPWGLVGTVEGIYSKTLNNIIYQNINRTNPTATLTGGPDNRTIYPNTYISSGYTDVILVTIPTKAIAIV